MKIADALSVDTGFTTVRCATKQDTASSAVRGVSQKLRPPTAFGLCGEPSLRGGVEPTTP